MAQYWLMKSEPSCFSIDDLYSRPHHTAPWDGVRNYQARNFMWRDMVVGDLAFFYQSSCSVPGIVGVMKIVSSAYPDDTAFDPNSDHPDPNSTPENPRWFMVDVCFQEKFSQVISIDVLRKHSALANMLILRKGNRLSITPVTREEWDFIQSLR